MPDHTPSPQIPAPAAADEISDGHLLAFLITAESRRRAAARGGITLLLRPFPNCPTCGQPVDGARDNATSIVDRILGPWAMTLNPCGHAFTCDLMKAEQIAEQARRMVDDQDALTHEDKKALAAERAAERAAADEAAAPEGCPEPGPDDSDSSLEEAQSTAARQPAYDAVYAYIRTLPRGAGDVERNATIFRAVNHALDAAGVGRCIASHCVEGDHILHADQPTA